MIYLTEEDILKIHSYVINTYGGADGVLNENLIGSIIYSTSYYENIVDITTSYFCKLVKDHIFRDGNKRTACLALNMFLELNGKELTLTNNELYEMSIDVANDKIFDSSVSMKLLTSIK